MKRRGRSKTLAGACLACAAVMGGAVQAAPVLQPCRLDGIEHEARCGRVERALDPSQPDGPRIAVHFAVLPALARHRHPDPVFFFAGGPGQSAIDLAGPVAGMLARFRNRRDIVLIDQRGTGRSAPLRCDGDDAVDAALALPPEAGAQRARLAACRSRLQALPYADLRQFTTAIAAADADAVRAALGAGQVNLVGVSYGTRLALAYLRQFPGHVRRVVLDGVAPPDMVLPQAFAADQRRAVDAVLSGCEADPACARRHGGLRARWAALRGGPPREWPVVHPVTGEVVRQRVTAEVLDAAVRGPLYSPALASALPEAMDAAVRGRLEPLAGLAHAAAGRRGQGVAMGMHLSVVCAEDVPRLPPASSDEDATVRSYRDACASWPRGAVPPAFYTLPAATAPVLLLSGGLDPVTPPRHGERVAGALGEQARHVVVPQAGHGVLALPCLREVLFRFVDTDEATAAASAVAADAQCAAGVPRPPTYLPMEPRR
ncbi:alpha/beta fold hydrolase [Aquincola sp. MAHUQ-54]|uniref:Alpha/beta fold hydrolase n=1 Tax=Aquincola agrisoli TaxID=3119538 RepID=A0AAW9QMG4_9BURK